MADDRPLLREDLNRRRFLHGAGVAGAVAALAAGLPAPMASALLAGAQPSDLPEGTSAQKVLLIAIDGVRRDAVNLTTTPVLSALALQGQLSHARTHKPPPRTITGPGHANILTGVWPGKHEVTSNNVTPNNLSGYPDFLTRLRSVRPKLSTFAVGDLSMVINKLIGKPHVKAVVPGASGSLESTHQVALWAAEAVRAQNPDVGYVYFLMPDRVGHSHGGASFDYTRAVGYVDRAIGFILANMTLRPTFLLEDWLVLVTTDHGHLDEGGHGGSQAVVRDIWTIAAGGYVPRLERGTGKTKMVDLVPTAFKHLGVGNKSSWKLDGKAIPA